MIKKSVVIVIPTYKKELDTDEEISLCQVFSILSDYDISFIAPQKLDIKYECIAEKTYDIRRFNDNYFNGVSGYSSLCTSMEFYKAFEEYEFMLIYQLDAFVFKDELKEFCDKNFDYWGAPVPNVYWKQMPGNVGNGGFSLRRISKFIKILEHRNEIEKIIDERLSEYWRNDFKKNEDEFLLYGASLYSDIDFKIPSLEEAFKFSIEFNINRIYEDLEDHIPFGCHRWARYKLNAWLPIIERYGYKVDNEYKEKLLKESRDDSYNILVLYNVLNCMKNNDRKQLLERCFGTAEVSVWGMGKASEKIINQLISIGFEVNKKYDKKMADGNLIIEPSKKNLIIENNYIVVTSTKYEKEIKEEYETITGNTSERIKNYKEIEKQLLKYMNIDVEGEKI